MANKTSVTQTHKGNNIINLEEYILPSGVTQTLPFDAFWDLYPRKVAKGHARLAFKKACDKVKPETIMDAVKKFAAAVEGKEKQYIPHPTTWLNGERWEDDLDEIETNSDKLNSILNMDVAAELDNVVDIRKIGKK